MRNLESLHLPAENERRLESESHKLWKTAHIAIEVVSFDDGRLIVRAEQKDMVNERFLTKKELTQRVRDMFHGEIPSDWKLTVSAVDFDRKDIDAVNVTWIKHRMEKLGLKNKHVSNYTGIDKCTVSSLLSGEKDLTKWHKVAMYYFFKYHEVARF